MPVVVHGGDSSAATTCLHSPGDLHGDAVTSCGGSELGEVRPSTTIIGAGIFGLSCARLLTARGHHLTIFEKARRPGGRCATRRTDSGLSFNHGAQEVSVVHPGFADCVAGSVERGIAAEWSARVARFAGGRTEVIKRATRYTGVPGMSAIANDLAEGLSIRTNDRVIGVDRRVSGWVFATGGRDPHGPFGELIIALPAPQTAELLRGHSFSDEARAVPMVPCWCVMVRDGGLPPANPRGLGCSDGH